MKFVRIFFFATLCLMAQAVTVQAQTTPKQRAVIWLKGYTAEEGGSLGWQPYDSLFTAQRYMKGLRPPYATDRTIDSIASITRTSVGNLLADTTVSFDPPPIAIGHSMGGLVARSMERLNRIQNKAQQFGGIINVATPHQGSEFNRALRDGTVNEWLFRSSATLDSIFYAHKNSRIQISPKIFALPSEPQDNSLIGIGKALNRFLDSALINNLTAPNNGNARAAFLDMIPNSPFLEQLNNSTQPNDTMDMISVNCTAYFPSFYRVTYSSTQHRPESDPIDQHNDNGVEKNVNTLARLLWMLGPTDVLHRAEELYSSGQIVQDPSAVLSLAVANGYVEDLLRTWRNLKYDIPAAACVLMGSASFQYRTVQQWVTQTANADDGKPVFAYEQRGEFVPIITDTDDGTLWRESQTHPRRRNRTFEALGANHVSALNHRAVRLRLQQFFSTEPKFIIDSRNR